ITGDLASNLQIGSDAVVVIVWVYKIAACVVRRVNINRLDPSSITLLQKLQHLQVVALDHQVLGGVPVHAVFRARTQRTGGGRERKLTRAPLSVPVETVLL